MNLDNPDIIVVPYKINDITVNVIRDDINFLGGTKERALIKYIEYYHKYSEFVYVGPSSGFAQIALTDCCNKLKKKATLFLINPPGYEPYLSLWCEKMGANVKYFSNKISEIEKIAEEYVRVKKGRAFLIPFGLDDPVYSDFLFTQLQQAIPVNIVPKRLWITVGSGTLLRVLANIWTNTEFMPVRVGKNLFEDQYDSGVWMRMGGEERIVRLTAPQKFFERVSDELLPPYPSVANYDAKVWQQVLKYAQDGDYIWNVASEENIILKDSQSYYIKVSDYLPNHPTDDDYHQAARQLIPLVKSEKIWFPYQKYFMQNPKILFENLRVNHLKILHPKDYELRSYFPKFKSYLITNKVLVEKKGKKVPKYISYALFRDRPTTVLGLQGEYNTIDVITDYFVEDIRLKTRRYDQEYSVIDSWKIDSYLELIFTIALKAGDITPKTLRSAIYYAIQEAGTFQPSKARGLLEAVMGTKLAGKRWLDISAGWGDRLIAAMSLDMIYTGYDPNIELKKGHDEMITMFGDKNKHRVIYAPFEKSDIVGGPYDVVLTSPPFFDVEDYAQGQEGQSIVNYPGFTQWTVRFLFAALIKAWDNLAEGGYLILHLADAINQKDANKSLNICETTMIFIENYLPGASWEGIIGSSGESGFFRPVFVWVKTNRYDNPKRWVSKNNFYDHKLYNIPQSWLDNNHVIPRALYFTYPEVQKELLKFYADMYLPPNMIINNYNIDLFFNRVIEYFPQIEDGLIVDLFVGVEQIPKLVEFLGLDNTVKFGIAMVKLALCDNINSRC